MYINEKIQECLRFKFETAENFHIFCRAHDDVLSPDSLNILWSVWFKKCVCRLVAALKFGEECRLGSG